MSVEVILLNLSSVLILVFIARIVCMVLGFLEIRTVSVIPIVHVPNSLCFEVYCIHCSETQQSKHDQDFHAQHVITEFEVLAKYQIFKNGPYFLPLTPKHLVWVS